MIQEEEIRDDAPTNENTTVTVQLTNASTGLLYCFDRSPTNENPTVTAQLLSANAFMAKEIAHICPAKNPANSAKQNARTGCPR